jgi:flagella synthesis protein FlgN
MNARTELVKALAATVAEIAATAHQLQQVLQAEHAALIAADEHGLLAATAQKTQCLQRLDALEVERAHLLALCVDGGRSQPFAMTRALAERPDALLAWEQAVQTLEDCRSRNQVNGSTVEARLRHVRRALELLTGASTESDLYGRHGTSEKLRRSQTLARI